MILLLPFVFWLVSGIVMNILVLGKAKTGTTIISQTIRQSLEGESEYVFEPSTETLFQETYGDKHVVAKILFEMWKTNQSRLGAILDNRYPLAFDKRVILLRDPRDEIISFLLYYPYDLKRAIPNPELYEEWIRCLQQKEREPQSISFLGMCRKFDELFNVNFTSGLTRYNVFDSGYTRFRQSMTSGSILYRYEDFMQDNVAPLEGYLGIRLTAERNVGEEYGQTLRSGSYNNWKRYFTPEDIAFFRSHEQFFEMLGYCDWELTPPDSIPESELSGYVRKLL